MFNDINLINFLKRKAYELRIDVIDMIYYAGSGHPGGSLSAAEIVTVLYWDAMKLDPENPKDEDRDRFVLSKGHACPIVYAALSHKGFFDRTELKTLRHTGSCLQGHPCYLKTPGIDISTGSLGQGLSIATGMAMGARQAGKNFHVYALISDGEMQEGMIWEAAMCCSHYKLDNITAVIDYNNLQVDGYVNEVMNIEPLEDKWKAFGWNCLTVNGHEIKSLMDAFKEVKEIKGKPSVIICKTLKGKGVSFMEDVMEWHASPIDEDLRQKAINELRNAIELIENKK